MTDMEGNARNKATQVFTDAFADSIAEALTHSAGRPWQIQVQGEPDLSTRHGDAIYYRFTLTGSLTGDCFLEVYESQIAALASVTQAKPGPAGETERADSFREVIAAAASGLVTSVSRSNGEVAVKAERTVAVSFGGMFAVSLRASDTQGAALGMLLYIDNHLVAELSGGSWNESVDPATVQVHPANFKLLMDVELKVSLRFGQRQMPLREVLELTSGSVIELDRQVDEPVELLLDGKVIARGRAVIVDGNYGLRVTEIPQPMTSHFIG
jgi:flagellar motor switch protein FliN/FliY